MKRFLLCVGTIMITILTYAQDIIVTTDAKKIEAKITEVSKSEIKYKENDNPNGPTFVLTTEEISSIIYANGKVVIYNQALQITEKISNQEANTIAKQEENTATILLLSGYTLSGELLEMNSKYVAYLDNGERKTIPASQIQSVTLANGQIKTYADINSASLPDVQSTTTSKTKTQEGRIYRDKGHFIHNDVYISSKQVGRILEKENSEAYKQWQKADKMLLGGSICAGIGGGLVIGGLIGLISSPIICLGLEGAALVPLGVGLGLTLGSSAKYNKAIDIYNSKFDHAAMQLRWFVSPNGVGLALAF